MRKLCCIVFILVQLTAYAQKSTYLVKGNLFLQNRTSELLTDHIFFGGNENSVDWNIQQYFISTLPQLANPLSRLQLMSKQKGPLGFHYNYIQTYNNKLVFGSELKVNVDVYGNLISAFNGLFNMPPNAPLYTTGVWFFDGNNLIPALLNNADNYCTLKDENGLLLYEENLNKYLFPQDSMVQAKVFFPDPLTSAQVAYGTPYIDNNDGDVAELNAQRKTVLLRVDFSNDTFRLTNQYFQLIDFDFPAIAPVQSKAPFFDYTRSQSGFEDVNIFYHLNMYRNHVDSIGFQQYVKDSMMVDAHAMGTADNSMYSTYNGKPAMFYGIGGIDDGEDADVIVHEYTHSIIDKATVTDNESIERQAIDEAICDYMAAAYSKNISTYNWKHLYNWDGNNASLQWFGRDAGSDKTYPYNSSMNYYWNSEIFSGALADLDDRIGSLLTEQLLLGTLGSISRTATMKQVAALMLITDSIVFNKAHSFPVQLAFYDRKIISQMTNVPVFNKTSLHILNSDAFTGGNGNLTVSYDGAEQIHLSCYDITGRQVMKEQTFYKQAIVSPSFLSSGVYIMQVRINGMIHAFKVVRN